MSYPASTPDFVVVVLLIPPMNIPPIASSDSKRALEECTVMKNAETNKEAHSLPSMS
jgi:hypothetical protein